MKTSSLFSQISLLVFLIAFEVISYGQTDVSIDRTKVDKIHQLLSTYAEYGKFNGAVLVAEKGKVIYKKGFGLANMEWDIPNQTDTKFRIASVTKQFTAMLIVQLVAEGKLALDIPISTYLSNYPKENGDKITIHHLLTHTSGIPNYTSFANYKAVMRQPKKPIELVHSFADSSLHFTPGKKFRYSNSGYILLGVILEQVTGQSFEKVLQEKILTPLKMDNTGFDDNKSLLKNRAAGYNQDVGRFSKANYMDISSAFTAGSMYSSVEDLFLWDQALYTSTLLPKKYMDLVFEKHIPAWGRHYAYGWDIGELSIGNTQQKIKTIEHGGFVNGFNALILRLPSDHSSILLLNNTGGAPLHQMSEAIAGILYNQPYDFPKKSLAHSLLETINKEGITKGIKHFESVKGDPIYNLDEHEMNRVSYELLQAEQGEAAAEVLQLGIAAFPYAFNLYDSYGEVLLALGKKEASIKNYKKSVRLNPENKNGLKVLRQLGIDIDPESLYLLKSGDEWGKELFTFPLNFAKDLAYSGVEEAHFPRGWKQTESAEFWSYAFVWKIDLANELSNNQLEQDLQVYFDGLSKVVNKDKNLVLPKTVAQIHPTKTADGLAKLSGTVNIFDAFVTKKALTLNVLVEKDYCKEEKKAIVLFRFSPKAFGHAIWTELEKITPHHTICDD